MEIDDDLQAQSSGPVYRSIDVVPCTWNIRRTESVVRPVSNWDPHNIESCLLNLVEVMPCHPRIPMVAEDAKRGIFPQMLSQCVLVDDVFLWSILIRVIEYRWCDPSVSIQPTTPVPVLWRIDNLRF